MDGRGHWSPGPSFSRASVNTKTGVQVEAQVVLYCCGGVMVGSGIYRSTYFLY